MTNLTRNHPWSRLSNFQDELATIFNQSLPADDSNVATSQWKPAVDISEHKNEFVLHADLPGVEGNDIHVSMEDGILSIEGERHSSHSESGNNYKRLERSVGKFYRRFSLPDTADSEKISAKNKHGVLEIVIPKKEKDKERRIPVEGL